MPRLCYFKETSPIEGLDAVQNAALLSIGNQLSTLNQSVGLKASIVALEAQADDLNGKINAKAASAYVDSQLSLKSNITYVDAQLTAKADASAMLQNLAAKADKSYVDAQDGINTASVVALTAVVGGKASSDDIIAVNAQITSINSSLGNKLDASVHAARVANEATFYESVKESMVFLDSNGNELDYVALGLVPAPVVPQVQ